MNGGTKLNCCVLTPCVSSSLSFIVCYGQTFTLCTEAKKPVVAGVPRGYVGISCITPIIGDECLGPGNYYVCAYTKSSA